MTCSVSFQTEMFFDAIQTVCIWCPVISQTIDCSVITPADRQQWSSRQQRCYMLYSLQTGSQVTSEVYLIWLVSQRSVSVQTTSLSPLCLLCLASQSAEDHESTWTALNAADNHDSKYSSCELAHLLQRSIQWTSPVTTTQHRVVLNLWNWSIKYIKQSSQSPTRF